MFQSPFLCFYVEVTRYFFLVSATHCWLLHSISCSITFARFQHYLFHHLISAPLFSFSSFGLIAFCFRLLRCWPMLIMNLLSHLRSHHWFIVRLLRSVPQTGERRSFSQFLVITGTLGHSNSITYQLKHCFWRIFINLDLCICVMSFFIGIYHFCTLCLNLFKVITRFGWCERAHKLKHSIELSDFAVFKISLFEEM